LILIIEGLVSYLIVTMVISKALKGVGKRQRKTMLVLESYILATLVFSALNLFGSSYVMELLPVSILEIYINFLLHLGLVPYAWIVLIKKTR